VPGGLTDNLGADRSLGATEAMNGVQKLLLGTTPEKTAPRVERLRWIRGIYPRSLPMVALCLGLMTVSFHEYLLAAVVGVPWLYGLVSVNLAIKREQHKEQE
jgi:hypothetical protein